MKKYIYLIVTLILLVIDSSCKKHTVDNCITNETLNVLPTGPNTGLVNQNINYNLSFDYNSHCGYQHIDEHVIFDTTVVYFQIQNALCDCNRDSLTSGNATYVFHKSLPGLYYIKFMQQNGSSIIDTVNIQ